MNSCIWSPRSVAAIDSGRLSNASCSSSSSSSRLLSSSVSFEKIFAILRRLALFIFGGSFLVGLDLEKASNLSLEKCLAEFWKFLAHLLRGRLHVSSVFSEVGKDPLAGNLVGAILIFFRSSYRPRVKRKGLEPLSSCRGVGQSRHCPKPALGSFWFRCGHP